LEVVVHPTSGGKKLFQADTQEDLNRQIAAWVRLQNLLAERRSREPDRTPSPGDLSR
jgi:hypothetical protein